MDLISHILLGLVIDLYFGNGCTLYLADPIQCFLFVKIGRSVFTAASFFLSFQVPVEQVNQYLDQLRRQQLLDVDNVEGGGTGKRYYNEDKLLNCYRGKDERLLTSSFTDDISLLGESLKQVLSFKQLIVLFFYTRLF